MPVDPSFIGRRYPPTPRYRVSREKIREFADALSDANPAYRSAEAARELGYADVIAPPTFLIVLTLPAGHQFLGDPETGIDYGRVVHGEQRFVHERPVVAGDVLSVVVTVQDIRLAAGNDLLTLRAQVYDETEELVATAYSIIVVRGADR